MSNRYWPGLCLLALLVLTLTLFPQPAGAHSSAPQSQAYAYDCLVYFRDLVGDTVICNGVTLSGSKHFYTTRVAPSQTVSISGTVTKLSFTCREIAYLRITSVSGSVSEWRSLSKSGTIFWTNTTGAAQDINLSWRSNGPGSTCRVQGSVEVS